MIIDADCHVSPGREGGNSITVEELLRRMDASGVDKAVTWLQPPYGREVDPSNRYVYEATCSHPGRILGFGWADPNLGLQKAKDTVRQCVEEFGFFGIKLNGAQNEYYVDDPEIALPVAEEIANAGKVIAFHVGADAYERTHPFRVAKIARRFPQTPVLMVHMGGASFHDLSNAVIEIAQDCPNMILVGSAVRAIPILKAIKTLGAARVCFGSDTPFELMHVEMAKYGALLEGEVTEAERALIMGGNIARIFNLSSSRARAGE
jgi:predicted TIM-barrel fold metal-dependent hydrolase